MVPEGRECAFKWLQLDLACGSRSDDKVDFQQLLSGMPLLEHLHLVAPDEGYNASLLDALELLPSLTALELSMAIPMIATEGLMEVLSGMPRLVSLRTRSLRLAKMVQAAAVMPPKALTGLTGLTLLSLECVDREQLCRVLESGATTLRQLSLRASALPRPRQDALLVALGKLKALEDFEFYIDYPSPIPSATAIALVEENLMSVKRLVLSATSSSLTRELVPRVSGVHSLEPGHWQGYQQLHAAVAD